MVATRKQRSSLPAQASFADELHASITVASGNATAKRGRPTRSARSSKANEVLEPDTVYEAEPQSNHIFERVTAVVVPTMASGAFKRQPLHTNRYSASTSTASSVVSPTTAYSESATGFETPNTSIAVTPVDSAASRASSAAVAAKGKGKSRPLTLAHRHIDIVDVDGDERLALQLQHDEYNLEEEAHTAGTSRDRPLNISSNTSSLSDTSELESDYNSDSSVIPIIHRKRKPPQGFRRTSNPPKKAKTTPSLPDKRSAPKSAPTGSKAKIIGSTIPDSDEEGLPKDQWPESDLGNDSELEYIESESVYDDDDGDSDASVDPAADVSVDWRAMGADGATTRIRQINAWNESRQARRGRQRMRSERQKLEKTHPEIKTMWKDLEDSPKIITEQAPQPESISRQLKPFQLEGLNWMKKQEQTKWKGGLLGDEMGMGKTIQAVSLIMSDYPAKQPTLVVVPPVALMQWTNEINEYTDGKLKVLIYHGTNSKAKTLTVKQLKGYNVIMISYAGLESIYRKETKGWKRHDKIIKEDSAMHAIHFHRIILDEAHSIKQRTAGVAKACFALQGTYKWCLSGTPVQNRIGEFFSLLRFLEVAPFANYFCKSCSCSSMHWTIDASYRCTSCSHRGLEHVSVFNQEILNPITNSESDVARKEALRKLRLLTDRIMLRRLKRDQTTSMELPPKEIILHQEFFGEIERDFSSSIMSNTTRVFDTYVSRGVMLNNYANIFGLIMQMRQVSDHPDLLLKRGAEGSQNVLVCNICDEPAEDAIRSGCKHEFCRSCVKDYVRSCEGAGAKPDCPKCHITLAIDFDQPAIEQDEDSVKKSSIINRIKMENWTSSTKIEMLVYDLWKLRSPRQTTKSIVFSQFTSMLQLVEWRLRRAGFNTVMLDGTMTPAQRQNSIDHFMNNTDCEVFLVSLKAGGVALNLTEASRVFIVDPWWNPAAEWQSADRCHRIGQKRPCVITRLCIEDSVESRIVALQEKKAHMINGTVNNDDVAIEKLTPEDMQFLFRGS